LAFICFFLVMAVVYILRPVRDTVATLVGVGRLQLLFTGTFIGTLLASPLYTWLAAHVRLSRLLPAVFWFWLLNVLVFAGLLRLAPDNLWLAGGYYVWFSVVNLFIVSVFWSLMVDLFTAVQATRLFALIAAGGELGAIAGPILTRVLVSRLGLPGLLLLAAAGFVLIVLLVHLLMHEKRRLREHGALAQASSLEHDLPGNPLAGFRELFSSGYALAQGGYIWLMTWVATVGFFFQTDIIAHAFPSLAGRAQAIADIDLAVNICTAVVLIFGMGHVLRRFGVTVALLLSPLLMLAAFAALLVAPSLLMIQALQVVRRVSQYAIVRPSREICFTVMPQASRYRTKNVIDTVVYRFGDLSSAWTQSGLLAAGFGLAAGAVLAMGGAVVWGGCGGYLGRRYEKLHRLPAGSVS
jgi:ATP:ADP antiporter, AAA family